MKLPKKTVETMLMFMSTAQDREGAAIFAKALLDDPCLVRPHLIPQVRVGTKKPTKPIVVVTYH